MDLPPAERALEEKALAHTRQGEMEEAAWAFLEGAQHALARADYERVLALHRVASGQQQKADALIDEARAGFEAAGDRAGALAARTAQAERAIRAHDRVRARELVTALVPELAVHGAPKVGEALQEMLAALEKSS